MKKKIIALILLGLIFNIKSQINFFDPTDINPPIYTKTELNIRGNIYIEKYDNYSVNNDYFSKTYFRKGTYVNMKEDLADGDNAKIDKNALIQKLKTIFPQSTISKYDAKYSAIGFSFVIDANGKIIGNSISIWSKSNISLTQIALMDEMIKTNCLKFTIERKTAKYVISDIDIKITDLYK